MNRQDVIDQYRQNIAAEKRTRLSSADLQGLIVDFIDRLKPLDSQPDIDELCRAEIALLEEGYKPDTIGKNYIPQYRKAILAATADGTLPLTKNTLLDYDYAKRDGTIEHFRGHYAYRQFKYDEAQYEAIAQADNQRNNQKQDSLQPVPLDAYLEKAIDLLGSQSFEELAAAIAALTGRRFSEVMESQFERTDHPYKLRFAGQLKKRGVVEAYQTLCLIPADQVWQAIERFRHLPRTQHLQGKTKQKINALANKRIQRTVNEQFGTTEIVPVLAGESAVTIHNLRAIYGVIGIHFFCPPSRGDHRFLQEQLGHIIGQRNLEKLRNSPSTAHYFHYYLMDANSQHIGAKGVKLAELSAIEPTLQAEIELATEPEVTALDAVTSEPVLDIEQSTEAEATAPDETEITTPKIPAIEAEPEIEAATSTEAIAQDTAAIDLKPEATPEPESKPEITPSEEVLPELPEIAASSQAVAPSQVTPEPTLIPAMEPNFMESLAELSQTIGFLRRQVERQERQLEALQSERDRLALDLQMLREQLSEAEALKMQRETEAEPLHQRITQLEAENQDQRDQLARVYRAMGVNPAQLVPSTPTQAEPTPAPMIEPTPAPAIVTTPTPTRTIVPNTPSTRAIVTPTAPQTKAAKAKSTAKSGKRIPVQVKLEKAVEFIKDYNNSAASTQYWALSQTLIAALTGSNVKNNVKPFWTEIKADADAYNARMGFPDAAAQNQQRTKGNKEEIMQQLREDFDTWLSAQISGAAEGDRT